jgi:hypothetical protein
VRGMKKRNEKKKWTPKLLLMHFDCARTLAYSAARIHYFTSIRSHSLARIRLFLRTNTHTHTHTHTHTQVVVDDATAELADDGDGADVDSDLDVDDDDDAGDAAPTAPVVTPAAAASTASSPRPMTLARERPTPSEPAAPPAPAAVAKLAPVAMAPRKSARLQDRKLGASVRAGALDTESAMQAVKWVDDNVRRLIEAIVGCVSLPPFVKQILLFFFSHLCAVWKPV